MRRTIHFRKTALALTLAAAAPGAARGEEAAPPAEGEPIVVEGTRLRGELEVEQPPIAEIDSADIAALGAGSLAELLQALAPATGSAARGSRGTGQPVFLLNGVRVANPRDFRNYPPEAVAKVEIFPEEVAQRFGFPADQRVVNIILKPDFRMLTADAEYEQPDRGGYSRTEQGLSFLKVGEAGRINLAATATDTSLLTEAERDAAGSPYRSLVADAFTLDVTGNYARAFMGSGTTLSVSGAYGRSESRSLAGLADDGSETLERRSSSDTLSLGGVLSRPLGRWMGTLTSDGLVALGETATDRRDGSGIDTADTRTVTFVNKATVTGRPYALPAGDLGVTFDLALDWKRYESDDSRSGSAIAVTRRRLGGGTNVTVPLAERGGAWGALGDVAVSLGLGIEDLSDAGTLGNWSAGVTWGPSERLGLSATRLWREVAPAISQLGNPLIEDYNVPVFDPVSGATVPVTIVTGGNPDLRPETQADWKFAANWALPFWRDARVQLDYGRNRSRDVTASPSYSAAFEAAFPDRVIRNPDGSLARVDLRPVTLAATRSDILGVGLSARGTIGKAPPAPEGGEGRRGGGSGGPGRGFGPMGGDPNDPRARYFLNLTYARTLASTVTLGDGAPVFDQLAGEVLSGGTVPQDSAQFEGGLFWKGFGTRLSARYTGKAKLAAGDAPGSSTLFFGELATLDLRLFADLGQVLAKGGWAKGLRLSLVANNVFDGARRVEDANGITPAAYAPWRIDPTGRYLGVDVRKAF